MAELEAAVQEPGSARPADTVQETEIITTDFRTVREIIIMDSKTIPEITIMDSKIPETMVTVILAGTEEMAGACFLQYRDLQTLKIKVPVQQ